ASRGGCAAAEAARKFQDHAGAPLSRATPSPACGGRPGWGSLGRRLGVLVRLLRCPPPNPPPHAGEGAKEAAPRFRPFPRLRGGRDGGRLALAVASPFPCSDAPTPPSPARGGGSQRSRAARSCPFPRLRGREPRRVSRNRPDSLPRLRGKP